LNEGKREPLPIDQEDVRDFGLGDLPLVFQKSDSFNVATVVDTLRVKFGDRVRDVHTLPAQPAVYAHDHVLHRFHPGLQRAVRERLLPTDGNLYVFQAEAINAALDGHDVVVTTPTASGKSLTYTLPVMHTLLSDRSATALYLSPLVALTEDQLEALSRIDRSGTDWPKKGERFSIHRFCRTLDTGMGEVTIARYDGSVPTGDRQTIRERKPQYVLTTPDMLHAALLAGAFNERQWKYLFAGLRYVVIDELHTYRGMLGASFANLLRRLQRICRVHGANPQFICASATMVDPAQTVEQFIGRRPIVVDGTTTGAPQHKRAFVLWNSDSGDGTANALSTQAKNALLHLFDQRVRTIAFARSISEINDIYRFSTAELREQGIAEPAIKPFMRELLAQDKRAIIRDLKEGRLHGVISTTALSMGIDIGNLSAAVIIGFPGSIAQLWQQAGRAGRAGEGLIILVADRNPLDQFFVQHPDVLFNLHAEPMFLNPNNPYIVRGHLLCAAKEYPLSAADVTGLGEQAATEIARLCADGLLAHDGDDQFVVTEQGHAQANVAFRNLTFAVPVLTQDRKPVVEVDAARAQRALHKHAHYQHVDRYYRVVKCDLDWRRGQGEIIVQELEHPDYTTTARVEHHVTMVDREAHQTTQHYHAEYGHVQCCTRVEGYYQVPLFTRTDPFTFQPLGRAAPAPLEYQTQAFWLTFAPDALTNYPLEEQNAGLYSLAGALKLATAIEELCDPSDIESLGFVTHPDTALPTVMLYDAVLGGVGVAEAAFPRLSQVLQRARQILADCPYCSAHLESRGCPYCVTAQYGDENTINRQVALALLSKLLEQ
jgi:DEAD/DEAH box helicase domain-containing protein